MHYRQSSPPPPEPRPRLPPLLALSAGLGGLVGALVGPLPFNGWVLPEESGWVALGSTSLALVGWALLGGARDPRAR